MHVVDEDFMNPLRGSVGHTKNCTQHNVTIGPCTSDLHFIGYMYVITPMAIAGTLLNVVNQCIFYKFRNHGSTYFYLLALAAIDMLCLLLAVPIGPIRCVPPSHSWENWARGIYESYFYLGLGVVCDTISIWCTMVMSVDRYVQVRASHRSTAVFVETNRGPKRILGAVVILSIVVNFPYFLIKELNQHGHAVDRSFTMTSGFQVYTWIRMGLVKIIPVLTVAVSNGLLIKVLVEANRKRKSMVFPNTKQAKRQKIQIRVSAMLVSILITFILCHLLEPLSHTSLFAALWGKCEIYSEGHYTQIMITNGLEWFSYSSNFIFYCIFHKQFQDSLKRACCWVCNQRKGKSQVPATCLTATESKHETAVNQNNNT